MSARTFALGVAYGITVGILVRTLLDAGEKAARNARPKATRVAVRQQTTHDAVRRQERP